MDVVRPLVLLSVYQEGKSPKRRKTRPKRRKIREKSQEYVNRCKNTKPPNQNRTPHTSSDTPASSSLDKSLGRFLLKKSACQSLASSPRDGARRSLGRSPAGGLPALVRPRHSRNAAGTCTSNSGPSIPTMLLVRTPVTTWLISHRTTRVRRGVPVVRGVSWDGARQFWGWSPCGGCPRVPSGTATRPPRRARSQRGLKAPPGADPWPPEPPQPCCTLCNDTLKATLQHVVAGN